MNQQMQIGDIVRDMTADEIANHKTTMAEAETLVKQRASKATAREALLTKLGITAEEAQLLLGGM